MSEAQPQMPEGLDRTPTGEIKDQASTQPAQTTTETTETTPAEVKAEAEPAKSDKSLLTKDEKSEPAPGAPEKYESFTAPEGFVITDEANKDLTAMFKEANLPQATAQKFIDYVAPQILQAIEAPFKQYQETREGWQKEITDKYGSKLPEVKATIGRALDGLQNPKLVSAFKDALDHTGAGDNPAIWDVMYEFAKKVSEGTFVKAGGPSKFGQAAGNRPASAAAAVYPHLPSAG